MRPNAFSHPGKFFKGNIHTHSNLSDGDLDLGEVCRRYKEKGYDFSKFTDTQLTDHYHYTIFPAGIDYNFTIPGFQQ